MTKWNLSLEELEARVVPGLVVSPGNGVEDQDPTQPGLQKGDSDVPPQAGGEERPYNEQHGEETPIGND